MQKQAIRKSSVTGKRLKSKNEIEKRLKKCREEISLLEQEALEHALPKSQHEYMNCNSRGGE